MPISFASMNLPEAPTVVEGKQTSWQLAFNNLTADSFTYSYRFSTIGGTASSADFSGGSGSGSMSFYSTYPQTRTNTISFSALEDDLTEGTETVFLDISLAGIAFADGASFRRFEIAILDNLRPTGAATVSGSGWQDQVLSADTSTIEDADGLGAFSYQWLRDGIVISAATSDSYTTTDDDIGAGISVRVSYTDGAGVQESLTSAPLRIVDADEIIVGTAAAETLNGNDGDDLLIGSPLEDAAASAGAQVYRLYQATLGRAPDSAGFTGWTARIDGGQSVQEVIPGFVSSAEFQATYGALDNAGFVGLLYDNVLGRAPDDAGLAGWTERLEAGASRASVVAGFSESAEFRAKTAAAASAYVAAEEISTNMLDDVYRLYQATLDRDPDMQGLEGWAARLDADTDYETVANGFVASPEFRGTYGALDNAGFVTQLYRNVLGRDPDAAGLAGWTARLDEGASRASVVKGFAQAQEFVAATAADFLEFMRQNEGDVLEGGAGDDLLFTGIGADRFVFSASEAGRDRVLHLDPWDTIELNDFGFLRAADALDHFRQIGADTVFADGEVSVVFANTALGDIHEAMLSL